MHIFRNQPFVRPFGDLLCSRQPSPAASASDEKSVSLKVNNLQKFGDLELFSTGNKAFRDNIAATDPGFLTKLANEGQCMMRLPTLPSKFACRILI
jgi:hypothetical protein